MLLFDYYEKALNGFEGTKNIIIISASICTINDYTLILTIISIFTIYIITILFPWSIIIKLNEWFIFAI